MENGLDKNLQALIDAAKKTEVTEQERETQRRSFAFGNTNMENDRITREIVDAEAEKLKRRPE